MAVRHKLIDRIRKIAKEWKEHRRELEINGRYVDNVGEPLPLSVVKYMKALEKLREEGD